MLCYLLLAAEWKQISVFLVELLLNLIADDILICVRFYSRNQLFHLQIKLETSGRSNSCIKIYIRSNRVFLVVVKNCCFDRISFNRMELHGSLHLKPSIKESKLVSVKTSSYHRQKTRVQFAPKFCR